MAGKKAAAKPKKPAAQAKPATPAPAATRTPGPIEVHRSREPSRVTHS